MSKGSWLPTSKGSVASMRLASEKGRLSACVVSAGPGRAMTIWSTLPGGSCASSSCTAARSVSARSPSWARRTSANPWVVCVFVFASSTTPFTA